MSGEALILIGAVVVILALAWDNRHHPGAWHD